MNTIVRKPKIKVVEFPKTKFAELSTQITEGIVQTAFDAFGPGMTRREVLMHIYPADRLYLASIMGTVIGFATATLNHEAVDLTGVAIRGTEQGNSVYSDFCLRRINLGLNEGKGNVTLRTQNPKIELGVRLSLEELARLGAIKAFQLEREYIPSLYDRQLTAEQPFSGVEEIDSPYAKLNYSKGDAYSLTARLRK